MTSYAGRSGPRQLSDLPEYPETNTARSPCRVRLLATVLLVAAAIGSPTRADELAVDFTVVRTDTLYDLSHKICVSPAAWREVARINGLRNPDRITPGQVLRVPLRLM